MRGTLKIQLNRRDIAIISEALIFMAPSRTERERTNREIVSKVFLEATTAEPIQLTHDQLEAVSLAVTAYTYQISLDRLEEVEEVAAKIRSRFIDSDSL